MSPFVRRGDIIKISFIILLEDTYTENRCINKSNSNYNKIVSTKLQWAYHLNFIYIFVYIFINISSFLASNFIHDEPPVEKGKRLC
jgi:hypothetical protein